jgi:hypothetical protein
MRRNTHTLMLLARFDAKATSNLIMYQYSHDRTRQLLPLHVSYKPHTALTGPVTIHLYNHTQFASRYTTPFPRIPACAIHTDRTPHILSLSHTSHSLDYARSNLSLGFTNILLQTRHPNLRNHTFPSLWARKHQSIRTAASSNSEPPRSMQARPKVTMSMQCT